MSDKEKTPVFTHAFLNIVSNESACRKALGEISEMLSSHKFQTIGAEDAFIIGKCHRAAEDALKTPPRNCDMGTADEQYARWRSFCDSQKCCNNQCPVYKLADVCESKTRCNLIWAQMPYAEEGGAK